MVTVAPGASVQAQQPRADQVQPQPKATAKPHFSGVVLIVAFQKPVTLVLQDVSDAKQIHRG
eukprot:2304635-Amphidinium_carterae.2